MSCNITLGPINVYDYYTLIKHHKQAPKKKNAVWVFKLMFTMHI